MSEANLSFNGLLNRGDRKPYLRKKTTFEGVLEVAIHYIYLFVTLALGFLNAD